MHQLYKLGISVFDFWDMTPQEMYDLTQSYAEQKEQEMKEKMVMNYNLASMVSMFVNLGLNGKQIPSINEVYPTLYSQEEVQQNEMEVYKQQFEAFAIQHNSIRAQKGLNQ